MTGLDGETSAGYNAELILEMLEVTLQQGASLPRALWMVGQVLGDAHGAILMDIGTRLMFGQDWDKVWKAHLAVHPRLPVLGIIHKILEPSYKRGVSPQLRIEHAIEQLKDEQNQALLRASHELSIKILLPLGLCFLPGFIILTVVPLLSSWFSLS